MPTVSIIIVTFNSGNFIKRLLASILELNKGLDYEIIIVDNNSADNTLDLIRGYKVRIIKNKTNVGFARGINMATQHAQGKYLLLINPDMKWKSGSVNDFVGIFEKFNYVGVIGGKILNSVGVAEKSAGKFLKTTEVFSMTISLDEALGVRSSPNKRVEVDFVSGGFMAVRKELFESLSGFDENLFMYIEDMEFCYRVRKKGFKVLFDQMIQIIHESHGSSSRSFAIENIYKGLLYFQKKHGHILAFNSVKYMLKTKAYVLVLLGKIINNKYLTETYSRIVKHEENY